MGVLVSGFIFVLIRMASQFKVFLVSQIYVAFIFSTVKILQSVPSMPATGTTTRKRAFSPLLLLNGGMIWLKHYGFD